MNAVTIGRNEKKKIYLATFFNPVLGKRVTRSLGTGCKDEQTAAEIKRMIAEIINTDGCDSYPIYKEFKERFKEKSDYSNLVMKLIYDNSELQQHEYEEGLKRFLDESIKVKENDEFFRPAIVFVGGPGVGKTKVIQQLLGSTEYNTPASSSSNTTTSMLYVDVEPETNKVAFVFKINSMAKNYQAIKHNIYQVFTYLATLAQGEEINKDELLNKLLISNDLRYNLTFLISDKEYCNNLIGDIEESFGQVWTKFKDEFKSEKVSEVIGAFISLLDDEWTQSESEMATKELKEIVQQLDVDEFIQCLLTQVKKDKVKIIKEILKELKNIEKGMENVNLEVKTANKIELDQEISDKDLIDVNAMYIALSYKDNHCPDKELKNLLFEIMKYVSSSDEDSISLLPLLDSLRLKGNFSSDIDSKVKSSYMLIDSEGVGHNAGVVENSSELIYALQHATKVIWMIDASRPITNIEANTLSTLAANGCLYKTTLTWTKCDEIIAREEDIDNRIYKLLENLLKEFNNDEHIVAMQKHIKKDMLILGDMDKKIRDGKISVKYRGKTIEDTFEQRFADDFNKMIDMPQITKEELNVSYSLIYLSNILDSQIQRFILDFSAIVSSAHWTKVKAFTDRMAYNYCNRCYEQIAPEAKLRYLLKYPLEKFISNPIEYSEEAKQAKFNQLQMLQEELAKRVDKIIEQVVYKDNEIKWQQAYRLYGTGSGNQRKRDTIGIIRNSVAFDRSINKESKIYTEIIKNMLELEGKIKDLDVKLILERYVGETK